MVATRGQKLEQWNLLWIRLKQRAFIEFLTAESCSPVEILSWMKAVYGESCFDVSTVRQWAWRSNKEIPSESNARDQLHTGRALSVSDRRTNPEWMI